MRFIVALVTLAIAYFMLNSLEPLNAGALVAGGRVEVPYSWDVSGPRVVLASVSPPDAKWLRVASFSVYTGDAWVKGDEELSGKLGGAEYKISVTPYAIMLYPAMPVPQPAPGYTPQGQGLTKIKDEFRSDSFVIKVRVEYGAPFPYGEYPELGYRVSSLLGEPKGWSTPRVQALAAQLLERFRDKTLRELLGYLTSWLRDNYRYALRYSGTPAGDAADWFLFVSKTGMCVHFATAAAVLLNDMGIRARVVYGFANSYVNDGLRVFTTPTHLWVEVWTPSGWVPWDPSPPLTLASASGTPLQRSAPQAQTIQELGGGRGASARTAPPALRTNPLELLVMISALLLVSIYAAPLKGWLVAWPLAFRRCVERVYGAKGLTLREVAEITGIKELEHAQREYLLEGKWPRRGVLKALRWCLARWARRTRYRRR